MDAWREKKWIKEPLRHGQLQQASMLKATEAIVLMQTPCAQADCEGENGLYCFLAVCKSFVDHLTLDYEFIGIAPINPL